MLCAASHPRKRGRGGECKGALGEGEKQVIKSCQNVQEGKEIARP